MRREPGFWTQCSVTGCGETTRLPEPGRWTCAKHRAAPPPEHPKPTWTPFPRFPWGRVVALVLLVALPVYGQEDCRTIPIEVGTGQLRTRRTDTPLAIRGGTYLTDESSVCLAKRLAAAEAEVQVWRQAPVIAPPALIVATSVAFVLGAIVGFFSRGAGR